ncbi:unnamed protein product [Fusarium venenatum]|uniref:Uncharacterized protein n=1 Tax=Fusarium venenatum TaxID=56646 RepID=A0A2L2T8Y6_9HYPO|nr:uncharacterized protein FVRRES_06147 [Fusarium venenatum]CEI61711.1 unnamed protein product [Fusarium venenatum]
MKVICMDLTSEGSRDINYFIHQYGISSSPDLIRLPVKVQHFIRLTLPLDCQRACPDYGPTSRIGHPRRPNWEAVTILFPSDRVDSGRLSRPTPKAQNFQNRIFGQFGPSGPPGLRFLLAHAQESIYKNVAEEGCTAVADQQERPMGEETR